MFRSLNLYLFAGFIFSLQMAVLTALTFALLLGLLVPFTGGELLVMPLLMISGISAVLVFFSCLISFFMINTIKLWGIRFSTDSEGLWVLSVAALLANLKLLSGFDSILINYYISVLIISIVLILIGNSIYKRTLNKLEKLIATQSRDSD